MLVAGALEGGVEIRRIGLGFRCFGRHGSEVPPAAEPGIPRHDEARIHMRGRHARALHMCHQRHTCRQKAWVFLSARDLLAEFGGEFAKHGGDIDPHFFKNPALHDGHDPPAAFRPFPGSAGESPRRQAGMRARGQIILNRFKGGAKPVPQFLKPGAGRGHKGVALRAGGSFFHGRLPMLHGGAFTPCKSTYYKTPVLAGPMLRRRHFVVILAPQGCRPKSCGEVRPSARGLPVVKGW